MTFATVLTRLQSLDNPYPGLRPFEPEESHLFFGRDLQIRELLERLREKQFVAVIGVSGSGKSSLVRAGLIPALHREGLRSRRDSWRVAIMHPAGNPYEELAESLSASIGPDTDVSGLRQSSHPRLRKTPNQGDSGEYGGMERCFCGRPRRSTSRCESM